MSDLLSWVIAGLICVLAVAFGYILTPIHPIRLQSLHLCWIAMKQIFDLLTAGIGFLRLCLEGTIRFLFRREARDRNLLPDNGAASDPFKGRDGADRR